ncbi:MAG: transcription initiation factor IIB family protein [Caldisphaeraceae archaeon]|nr:transcription initiation factor IIB family protein [Caldisphaeraceae archaeon]
MNINRKCPYCGNPFLIHTYDGKIVCPKCGRIVAEDLIIEKPEWRSFNEKGMQSTKGLERGTETVNILRHDNGIGNLSFNAPRIRNYRRNKRFLRIKNMRHAINREERPQIQLFTMANRASSIFDLPRAARATLAEMLHKYIEKSNGSVGKDKSAVVAAALSKVVEIYNLNISQSEIEEFFGIDNNKIWVGKKRLNNLGILDAYKKMTLLRGSYSTGKDRQLERVLSYINRIVYDLGLSDFIIEQSIAFIRESTTINKTLYGKRPEAVAAAAVYLIARLNNREISQKDVAKSVGIKESTVRKLYKFLITNMAIVVSV